MLLYVLILLFILYGLLNHFFITLAILILFAICLCKSTDKRSYEEERAAAQYVDSEAIRAEFIKGLQ